MLWMVTVPRRKQQQQLNQVVVSAVEGRASGHRQGETMYFLANVLGYRSSIPFVDLLWQRGWRRLEHTSRKRDEGGMTL